MKKPVTMSDILRTDQSNYQAWTVLLTTGEPDPELQSVTVCLNDLHFYRALVTNIPPERRPAVARAIIHLDTLRANAATGLDSWGNTLATNAETK